MALVTISEAARLANKARKTLYAHIKQGKLSCTIDSDNVRKIDTSELIRFYGKIEQGNTEVTPPVTSEVTPSNTPIITEEIALLIASEIAKGIEKANKPLLRNIELLCDRVTQLTNRLEHKEVTPPVTEVTEKVTPPVTNNVTPPNFNYLDDIPVFGKPRNK